MPSVSIASRIESRRAGSLTLRRAPRSIETSPALGNQGAFPHRRRKPGKCCHRSRSSASSGRSSSASPSCSSSPAWPWPSPRRRWSAGRWWPPPSATPGPRCRCWPRWPARPPAGRARRRGRDRSRSSGTTSRPRPATTSSPSRWWSAPTATSWRGRCARSGPPGPTRRWRCTARAGPRGSASARGSSC